MRKLCVAMVGLPARGKSTLARRLREGLAVEGIKAEIFNNGNIRRSLLGAESTEADFYNPDNAFGREAREMICRRNIALAREWLKDGGDVAIMDATNASPARRAMLENAFSDLPLLFVECVNEDKLLLDACIRRKADLPEYASFDREAALENFLTRIAYYESIYRPLDREKFWLRVDSTANSILGEKPCEGSPYYPAIREIVVNFWVENLFVVRHGETEFNVQGRIGGDPMLTSRGREQARALAGRLSGESIDWVFTSTRLRSHETAAPLLAEKPSAHTMAFKEFDELWAGECEGMLYSEIREKMPEVTAGRNADKYGYAYPGGESYAMLRERVQRGLRRALFLAGGAPLVIVGHQAINRVLLTLFLNCRKADVPYIYIPQNQYYHISLTSRRKLFERIPFHG
ncbi:MAG: 6-phosphofructo-2-kinase/fructose-2,6-bisphosphatase [Desulfovibrio sp.]|jgi:broad specificity phosphatase PhoE/predicted kinase|nr:6-phosphofructo-2-kinase/fructose-2,6-bisphosphatase [Desulfovibrio sp.]